MIRVGVMGATGYTGLELIKIFKRRPDIELAWVTSENSAGQTLADVFAAPWEDQLIPSEEADLGAVDVAFLALPHGASTPAVKRAFDAGIKVIDLSADFRIHDQATYEKWYKTAHTAPELLPKAVYGIPELYRSAIREAQLIANPGCYPTSVILGLYPLVRHNLLAEPHAIADCKSGVSGAGRKMNLMYHFVEANDNFSPYNIGHVHRHVPEMEQELSAASSQPFTVTFSPHLLPVNQGILSTLYVRLKDPLTTDDLNALYREFYAGEPFMHILPAGKLATLRHVVNTNRVAISTTTVDNRGNAIIVACLDNLIKGASGAAIQNMNVMFELDETAGLL